MVSLVRHRPPPWGEGRQHWTTCVLDSTQKGPVAGVRTGRADVTVARDHAGGPADESARPRCSRAEHEAILSRLAQVCDEVARLPDCDAEPDDGLRMSGRLHR